MMSAPKDWAELAYAWGQYETRGTDRLPVDSERKAASFITDAIRDDKAGAWDEVRDEPDSCCGHCPMNKCPWDNGGAGPVNPYREVSQ